jgi:transcriptional regulator with XRE-family HTH domain
MAVAGHLPRIVWYMAGTSDSRLARELGGELKDLRESRNLSVRGLARKAALKTHAHISLAERGERLLKPEMLTTILEVLGTEPDQADRLMGLLREAEAPGEITAGVPGIGPILTELIEYEQAATVITDVAPLVLPGLLQTASYARSIMGAGPHAETRVALRIGRRDVLFRRDPVQLCALIDSEVLNRKMSDDPAMMIEQLRHLLDIGQRPNISIRLVSSTRPGWHPGLAGPFELIEFPKADPVVLLEHYRSSAFLRRREDVRDFQDAATEIEKVAMTPAESAEAIAFIVNGLETRTT